jgi:hypothetical protein
VFERRKNIAIARVGEKRVEKFKTKKVHKKPETNSTLPVLSLKNRT